MNSKQFLESTTSGSVATVATPVGKTQTRGKGVYPNEKGGNLLTGKKTNKKYANSNPMKESQEKNVAEASNRLTIPDSPYTRKNFGSEKLVEILKSRGWQGPFQIQQLGKKWIKSLDGLHGIDTDDYAMVQGKDPRYDGWVVYTGTYVFGIEYGYHTGDANKVANWTKDWNQDLSEAKLDEEDVIIVPGQGNRIKPGFIPRKADRTDHEVEMALSDLFQSAKNAKQVYELIKDIPETVGIEGWVQEKIIKANDYLNTVREYLEHKQLSEDTIQGKRDNFTVDDIKALEKIRDLETIKARAKELIKGFPDRRMKPEKIDYFYNRIDGLFSPMQVVKLMYDLLLAGEGMKTIGSRYSTSSNSYQRRFDEMTGDEVNEAAGKFAFKHPISGEIKKFSDRTKGQEWMKTAPSPKKTSARRLKADEIINYVISNSGDAIGEDPNTAPIVGDIITDTSYEFWDEYQKIEPLINQIMKKEYGSNSIDDFLQQSHADYWRDKTSEVNEAGERSALRYEMMLSNGSVKRFSAKDDADAKRIAKSAGAKSLIKLKADGISFKNKIAEQDVAEGEEKQVQDRKTGKMYDPDEEFKKLQNDPEYIAQMKRMGREEGKGWPKRKDEGAVEEGYRILPNIDRERYQEREGLEGPFRARNGKVYYYDPKAGLAYDPDTDFYIDYDELKMMDTEMSEGSDYQKPKLGTIKANLMNSEKPTVQVRVFKHDSIRNEDYWVNKGIKTFKTMELAQAYADRINKQNVDEGVDDTKKKISKYEELALAANRAGDDEKCKLYQRKIQALKQKMTQNVDEGILGKVLGGAALIASLWGIGQNQAQQVYDNSPQLQTLIKYHQMATQQGDEAKIQELERRIENQKTRLSVGKGEVMGPDDKPIVPSFESSIMKGIQNEQSSDKRDFKRSEMEHELGHETNNHAVMIDGKIWKVFADKRQAENIARSLRNKGKKASVGLTGASVSESQIPDKCPDCGGKLVAESELNEEGNKDACYHKVKSRYKVWPSAYASGALVKCRKVGASNWGNKSK